MQPHVTIHLLAFNGERFVGQCLDSVFAQTYPNIEVLATDNASKDGTREIIEKFKSLGLKVFYLEKNLGFAAGHNVGIRRSRGEYILCLNQDVVLDKDFVRHAVQAMESDPKVGAVQGKLLRQRADQIRNPKSEIRNPIIDTVGLLPFKSRRFVNRGQGEEDRGQYDTQGEIFGADGAAPLYRRAALENIKLPIPDTRYQIPDTACEYFDEDFFLYKEDIDLAWRLRLAGWKTIYRPTAVAWHWRGARESLKFKVESCLLRRSSRFSCEGRAKLQFKIQNYLNTVKSRYAIPSYAKYHSFKNQRFLLLKNDSPWYFMRHLPWALSYEIASWLWVIFFEPPSWRAMVEVFRRAPLMLRKRAFVQARRNVAWHDLYQWFQ